MLEIEIIYEKKNRGKKTCEIMNKLLSIFK